MNKKVTNIMNIASRAISTAIIAAITALITLPTFAQQLKKPHYPTPNGDSCFELKKAMPIYSEELKKDIKYSYAWRNAVKGTKFNKWHDAAYNELIAKLQPETPTTMFGVHPFAAPIHIVKGEMLSCNNDDAKDSTSIASKSKKENSSSAYTIARLEFNISKYAKAKSYLFIPEGEGPFPAIVLFHDHGASFDIGKEKMCNPKPFKFNEKTDSIVRDWCTRCYDDQYFANYLAEHGYVVFITDAIMWGDRRVKGGTDYEVQQALASNLMQMGTSLSQTIVWDDVHSIDFVSTLPQVDKKRIGVAGFSMGSFRAWMSSAANPKVAACVAVCWMNTTEQLMTMHNNQNKGGSAFCMLIPGLVRSFDYPDAASIIAPRPVLFMNGTKDKLFPLDGVNHAYQTMSEAWNAAGAKDKFESYISPGPHFFSKDMQKRALDFFDKYLKPQPSKVVR